MNILTIYKEIINSTDLNLKKDLAKSLQDNYQHLLRQVEITSITFEHQSLSITFATPEDLQNFYCMLLKDIVFPTEQDCLDAAKAIKEDREQKAMDKSGWFGWRSSKFQAGEDLRAIIVKLKEVVLKEGN